MAVEELLGTDNTTIQAEGAIHRKFLLSSKRAILEDHIIEALSEMLVLERAGSLIMATASSAERHDIVYLPHIQTGKTSNLMTHVINAVETGEFPNPFVRNIVTAPTLIDDWINFLTDSPRISVNFPWLTQSLTIICNTLSADENTYSAPSNSRLSIIGSCAKSAATNLIFQIAHTDLILLVPDENETTDLMRVVNNNIIDNPYLRIQYRRLDGLKKILAGVYGISES